MVKAEVQTPNKRKSFAKETPAKKQKVEVAQKTPAKPENTSKKANQSPNSNQANQKFNKKNKPGKVDNDSPKKVPPFAGTNALNKNKQQKSQGKPANGASQPKKEGEIKKRRGTFFTLKKTVCEKAGTKDAELLKNIDGKISDLKSKPELSKTAKKKLHILAKLKSVVETGHAPATQKKATPAPQAKQEKNKKPQPAKKQPAKAEPKKASAVEDEDDDDEDDEEEESDDEENAGEEVESGEEEEDSDEEEEEGGGDDDDEEEEDDEDDGGDDDDEESEEEPPTKGKPAKLVDTTLTNKQKGVELNDLKKSNLLQKGQKRFVLFIGNIPYDTTKQDLITHFIKAGEIIDVRLPMDKQSNKPRGFAYLEVKEEIAYQKCLSMHHSQLKGRRINVLYTQGGKKKGNDKKGQIKAKNMKLHALRKQGKLAGSVKQSQKRSFRRNKSRNQKAATAN